MNKRTSTTRQIREPPPDASGLAERRTWFHRQGLRSLLVCFLLVFVTFVVFWPVVHYDFVSLDDDVYVTENARVQQGLNWEGVRWAFKSLEAGFYQPFVWLSYMIDVTVFGNGAGGMHFTNLLLHAVNTLLLFLFFARATGALWRSALVAAFFALHPLHVEPVAWIASRKDVLSTFFGFLAVLCYACYAVPPRGGDQPASARRTLLFYFTALIFFVCGLMSKTMVVTLPLVLLLLDYWPLGRFSISDVRLKIWRLVAEKLPFLAAGIVSTIVTVRAENEADAISSLGRVSLSPRIGNAVLSYIHYLWQTVWPTNMAVSYPYPRTLMIESVVGAGFLLIAISVIVLVQARRRPYLAVGWIWYVAMLLPVSGLIQIGYHSRADRYTYVPLIGIFLALVWILGEFAIQRRMSKLLVGMIAGLVLTGYTAQTRRQLSCWRNGETLLTHAIAVTKDNDLAYNNLGAALARKGQVQKAIEAYQTALKINPLAANSLANIGNACAEAKQYADAINYYEKALAIAPGNTKTRCNLGRALLETAKLDEAANEFSFVLKRDPRCADAHEGLARVFARQARTNEAIAHYTEALRLDPGLVEVRNELGALLAASGKLDEAIQQFREALRTEPGNVDALNNLGFMLETRGQYAEAIACYESGLLLKADDTKLHYNLAHALTAIRRLDQAIAEYRLALRYDPNLVDAHCNLGVALSLKGQFSEAIDEYRQALRLNPNHGVTHNNLGNVLSDQGLFDEAVIHFQATLRLMPDNAAAHFTLGVALARLGRRDEAVKELTEVLRLNPEHEEARQQLRALGAAAP